MSLKKKVRVMKKFKVTATISFQYQGKVVAENEDEATDIIATKLENDPTIGSRFFEIDEIEEIKEKS